MPRSGPGRKVPDIDVLAGHYLKRGLEKHPDISKHIAKVDDLEEMSMLKLLKLAKQMDVDADALITATEQEEHERERHSMNFPAFRGELGFDLTFELVGKRITRKAKVVFEHTPEWQYFDLRKKAPFTGCASSMWHLEIAAIPEDHQQDGTVVHGKPYWIRLDDVTHEDVLPHELWDAVLDAVDEQCKQDDAQRRRAAAIKKASRGPGGRA